MKSIGPDWLKKAVFYEIYPQTFYDSNGDGIGDIPGIIAKLDYVRDLGCDAIWLNPFYTSPFGDAGYDISDYYSVSPRYGTLSDVKKLLRTAHGKGLRICFDLVPGHTSTEHPWFKASCQGVKNRYTNWYIWTDSTWEHAGPGLNTIQGYGERDGNYVTNFYYFQPALNYGFADPDPDKPWQLSPDHPDVRAVKREIMKIMRHWLDIGCDGFRVDLAGSLVKGDVDGRITGRFWRDVRMMIDRDYPHAALISEWSTPKHAIPAGFHVDFYHWTGGYISLFRKEIDKLIHKDITGSSYFEKSGQGDITQFLNAYLDQYEATRGKGYISIPSGNHDVARVNLGKSRDELKVIFAFLLTLPGVPFIYYGDEIGMLQLKGIKPIEGGYPPRSGARTPMQWTRGRNAGFSTAAKNKLYYPVDNRKNRPNVEQQEGDSKSLLNTVRKLITLRKNHNALQADGRFEVMYARKNKYPFVYRRTIGNEDLMIALNPASRPVTVTLDAPIRTHECKPLLVQRCEANHHRKSIKLSMQAISFGIFHI